MPLAFLSPVFKVPGASANCTLTWGLQTSHTWLGEVRNPGRQAQSFHPSTGDTACYGPVLMCRIKRGPVSRSRLPNTSLKADKSRGPRQGPLSKTNTGLRWPVGGLTNFRGKHPRLLVIQLLSICAPCSGPNTLSSPAIPKYSRSVCDLFINNNSVINY